MVLTAEKWRHVSEREFPVLLKQLKDTRLANDFWLSARFFTFLITRVFYTFLKDWMAGRTISAHFWAFNQESGPGAGCRTVPQRCEKAACNTEGGGRTLLEGFGYSDRPCARVLSVSGFFALSLLFPGSEGLFWRRERPLFPAERPPLFHPADKTVTTPCTALQVRTEERDGRRVQGRATYLRV